MSIRSSLLITARAARQAAPRVQVAPRRAASSAHKASSNTPWAIGSAAVFGSLAAFILMPSGDKAAHDVHEHIDAKGAGAHTGSEPGAVPEHEDEHHDNARDLVRKERAAGERTSEQEDPKGKMVHAGESRPRTEIPSKRDDEKPARRGASTGDKFDGTIDGPNMKAGVNNEGLKPDEQYKNGGDDKKSSSGSPDNVDDSNKPKASDLKEGIKQAVRNNNPLSAMQKESSGSSDSGSSTPDNVDDSDKPSDGAIKDSIKQAERSNSPLATMEEEVEESK